MIAIAKESVQHGFDREEGLGGNHSHPTFEQHPLPVRLANFRVLESENRLGRRLLKLTIAGGRTTYYCPTHQRRRS
jgi:hypothetical protein